MPASSAVRASTWRCRCSCRSAAALFASSSVNSAGGRRMGTQVSGVSGDVLLKVPAAGKHLYLSRTRPSSN